MVLQPLVPHLHIPSLTSSTICSDWEKSIQLYFSWPS